MWYLFGQIWLWLILSFILGWLANWFFCCRSKEPTVVVNGTDKIETPTDKPSATPNADDIAAKSAELGLNDNFKPQGFASTPASADDLKRISGIGAVNEKALNSLGIYQFQQIADWSRENIQWVEGFLAFPGRIDREAWVTQAKTLASGGTTEFAKKVDGGEVDY